MKIFIITDNLWWLEKARALFDGFKIDSHFFCSPKGAIIFQKQIHQGEIEIIDLKSKYEELILNFDIGFSIHCKQIFPKYLVESIRCINIHPGLNPHNRGWFPQVFSIINKKPVGATIHLMDKEVDHGNILFQEEVPIFPFDTSKTVYDRVLEAEYRLLKENLSSVLDKEFLGSTPLSSGNYNSIDDYNSLLELDLNQQMTLGDAIDLLRSLTHPPYKNAYFLTKENIKIYTSIILSKAEGLDKK